MNDITSIQISKETRNNLQAIGAKGETYEQIIKRLMIKQETKEATIDKWGKATISRSHAGKIIQYVVKTPPGEC